ncbi:MAG: c-type cytochrome [Candidatus Thiodiazotropha endolucinida]
MYIQTPMIKQLSVIIFLVTTLISTTLHAENKTFANVCSDCHTGGFKGWISGAPNVEKKEKWRKYLERDSLEEMRTIVLNGTEDHKKKGGCKTCTDSDIVNAIDYMMSLVK